MILLTTTPVTYIYQDVASDTQKCLEREENADILQKTLKPEELTDNEAERISECVKEKKKSHNIVGAFMLIGFVVLFTLVFIFT